MKAVMNVMEAIFTRHSVPRVKPDDVPRSLIEQVLAAGAQAPNHHKIYPWRFVVLTGEARSRMGEVMAQSLKERIPEVTEAALETEKARPLRAPVLIAVSAEPPSAPKVSEVENICAAAAAAQNMLLAAHSLGLGAMWRTGPAALDPRIKAFLGFSPEHHIIAFLYIGFPAAETQPPPRPSYAGQTEWME